MPLRRSAKHPAALNSKGGLAQFDRARSLGLMDLVLTEPPAS